MRRLPAKGNGATATSAGKAIPNGVPMQRGRTGSAAPASAKKPAPNAATAKSAPGLVLAMKNARLKRPLATQTAMTIGRKMENSWPAPPPYFDEPRLMLYRRLPVFGL